MCGAVQERDQNKLGVGAKFEIYRAAYLVMHERSECLIAVQEEFAMDFVLNDRDGHARANAGDILSNLFLGHKFMTWDYE